MPAAPLQLIYALGYSFGNLCFTMQKQEINYKMQVVPVKPLFNKKQGKFLSLYLKAYIVILQNYIQM